MRFPIIAHVQSCPACKRKILIEQAINGSNHTVGMNAVCVSCLTEAEIEEVKKHYPDLDIESQR